MSAHFVNDLHMRPLNGEQCYMFAVVHVLFQHFFLIGFTVFLNKSCYSISPK